MPLADLETRWIWQDGDIEFKVERKHSYVRAFTTAEYTCCYCGAKRYHLPGQHDQCDHSPTGECSEGSVTELKEIEKLDQHERGWRDGLEEAEEQIIKQYSRSDYLDINAGLRESDTTLASNRQVAALDSAIKKSRLPAALNVYRGAVLPASQINSAIRKFEGGEEVTISDKGFVSTSRSLSNAIDFTEKRTGERWRNVLFKIELAKGSRAALVERMSDHGGELEVILPRSSSFKIKNIERNKILRARKLNAVITLEAA